MILKENNPNMPVYDIIAKKPGKKKFINRRNLSRIAKPLLAEYNLPIISAYRGKRCYSHYESAMYTLNMERSDYIFAPSLRITHKHYDSITPQRDLLPQPYCICTGLPIVYDRLACSENKELPLTMKVCRKSDNWANQIGFSLKKINNDSYANNQNKYVFSQLLSDSTRLSKTKSIESKPNKFLSRSIFCDQLLKEKSPLFNYTEFVSKTSGFNEGLEPPKRICGAQVEFRFIDDDYAIESSELYPSNQQIYSPDFVCKIQVPADSSENYHEKKSCDSAFSWQDSIKLLKPICSSAVSSLKSCLFKFSSAPLTKDYKGVCSQIVLSSLSFSETDLNIKDKEEKLRSSVYETIKNTRFKTIKALKSNIDHGYFSKLENPYKPSFIDSFNLTKPELHHFNNFCLICNKLNLLIRLPKQGKHAKHGFPTPYTIYPTGNNIYTYRDGSLEKVSKDKYIYFDLLKRISFRMLSRSQAKYTFKQIKSLAFNSIPKKVYTPNKTDHILNQEVDLFKKYSNLGYKTNLTKWFQKNKICFDFSLTSNPSISENIISNICIHKFSKVKILSKSLITEEGSLNNKIKKLKSYIELDRNEKFTFNFPHIPISLPIDTDSKANLLNRFSKIKIDLTSWQINQFFYSVLSEKEVFKSNLKTQLLPLGKPYKLPIFNKIQSYELRNYKFYAGTGKRLLRPKYIPVKTIPVSKRSYIFPDEFAKVKKSYRCRIRLIPYPFGFPLFTFLAPIYKPLCAKYIPGIIDQHNTIKDQTMFPGPKKYKVYRNPLSLRDPKRFLYTIERSNLIGKDYFDFSSVYKLKKEHLSSRRNIIDQDFLPVFRSKSCSKHNYKIIASLSLKESYDPAYKNLLYSKIPLIFDYKLKNKHNLISRSLLPAAEIRKIYSFHSSSLNYSAVSNVVYEPCVIFKNFVKTSFNSGHLEFSLLKFYDYFIKQNFSTTLNKIDSSISGATFRTFLVPYKAPVNFKSFTPDKESWYEPLEHRVKLNLKHIEKFSFRLTRMTDFSPNFVTFGKLMGNIVSDPIFSYSAINQEANAFLSSSYKQVFINSNQSKNLSLYSEGPTNIHKYSQVETYKSTGSSVNIFKPNIKTRSSFIQCYASASFKESSITSKLSDSDQTSVKLYISDTNNKSIKFKLSSLCEEKFDIKSKNFSFGEKFDLPEINNYMNTGCYDRPMPGYMTNSANTNKMNFKYLITENKISANQCEKYEEAPKSALHKIQTQSPILLREKAHEPGTPDWIDMTAKRPVCSCLCL